MEYGIACQKYLHFKKSYNGLDDFAEKCSSYIIFHIIGRMNEWRRAFKFFDK